MGGPIAPADIQLSTRNLNRVIQYEPRDLTISMEAGVTYSELSRVLAGHNQMIPLDPPFAAQATIGGVLATNQSGPRRRLYGTARDMVIGMTFATMEGKLVQSGGMVVKNVAGLDMAKLMIGSFGTLAAMAVVNFKVHPMSSATRTFVRRFGRIGDAIAARDAVLKSVLQPAAIDIEKTIEGYRLLIQAGGNRAVLERYSRELAGSEILEGNEEESLWHEIREFTPAFLANHPEGAVVRISCKLSEVGSVLEKLPAPAIARAGSGVVYGYFAQAREAVAHGNGVLEFGSLIGQEPPGNEFAMMKKLKHMFDPESLLNRGRLYGRL